MPPQPGQTSQPPPSSSSSDIRQYFNNNMNISTASGDSDVLQDVVSVSEIVSGHQINSDEDNDEEAMGDENMEMEDSEESRKRT